jgi:hypothetical protein
LAPDLACLRKHVKKQLGSKFVVFQQAIACLKKQASRLNEAAEQFEADSSPSIEPISERQVGEFNAALQRQPFKKVDDARSD